MAENVFGGGGNKNAVVTQQPTIVDKTGENNTGAVVTQQPATDNTSGESVVTIEGDLTGFFSVVGIVIAISAAAIIAGLATSKIRKNKKDAKASKPDNDMPWES